MLITKLPHSSISSSGGGGGGGGSRYNARTCRATATPGE